ncbi:MAG: polysaccharide deacetylase family protein [Bacteroidia bacterium]
MNIKVFLFHRISPDIDPIWPPITPTHFEKIIQYLKRNFEIVPLENTILGNYKPTKSKKLCAITFDDGYKDFVEYAMPIIRKQNVPASMYVITDCVDANLPPWTFIFNHLLLNTKRSSIEINSIEIPDKLKKVSWKNTQEKINIINLFSPVLKRISDKERESVMQQIQTQIKDVDSPHNLMMNWDDIRAIKNIGIEIGSHSANHPPLSSDLRLDDVRHELKRSGEEIERETGKFPLAISYPFGMYSNESKKIAKEVGYKIGLTVSPKSYIFGEDQFEIPRIELYSEPFYKTRLRMNGQLQSLKNIFHKDKSLNSNG